MDARTNLFIDWLSLTLSINNSYHNEVMDRLHGLAVDGVIFREENAHSGLFKSYRTAYHIKLNQKEFCTIQVRPHIPSHRFMRIEWNPNKAQKAHIDSWHYIQNILSECIPSYSFDLITNANITRIDLSFDLRRIPIESLLVFATLRKNFSARYLQFHEKFGKTGRLNALEIGRSDGDQYLLIYDKNLERETRQSSGIPHSSVDSQNPRTAHRIKASRTRFELRLRSVGTWGDLNSISNPFERYTVISHINAGCVKNDHHWQFFIDSCKWRGAQAALSLIENRRERTCYRDALQVLDPPTWWSPEQIWVELPNAVRQTFGNDS